jgi:hypothetical protein
LFEEGVCLFAPGAQLNADQMVTRKTKRVALAAMVTEKEDGVKYAPMSFMGADYRACLSKICRSYAK